jgi:Xaa-Pro aminopeptidase
MTDVLIYADSIKSAEMRHEVPLAVPDPFLYGERNGARHVLAHSMETARMGDLGLELHPQEEYGFDELVQAGKTRNEIRIELVRRACRAWGIEDAVVPANFPLEIADGLREVGVRVRADRELFSRRRRVKNEAELEGIRRAQRAAEAGMAAARDLLRRARPEHGILAVDGEVLTSERVKQEIERVFSQHECSADEMIVSHGPQSAIGHHMGDGPIAPGEPVIIDVWPRDRESGCFADMTRTFVVGEPPPEIAEWYGLVYESLQRSLAEMRAGAKDKHVNDVASEVFEQAGYKTARSKEPGQPLQEGFYHGLGHGVGLEVHEEPTLGILGKDELLAGDVITVEPGLYRPDIGGVRLEDLVLVTDDGVENLTNFPYELTP